MRDGTPTKFETTAQVRMTRQERRDLDDWRRQQPDIPTRPEAIRVAIRTLLARDRSPATPPPRQRKAGNPS
jgi:hypothetical protein